MFVLQCRLLCFRWVLEIFSLWMMFWIVCMQVFVILGVWCFVFVIILVMILISGIFVWLQLISEYLVFWIWFVEFFMCVSLLVFFFMWVCLIGIVMSVLFLSLIFMDFLQVIGLLYCEIWQFLFRFGQKQFLCVNWFDEVIEQLSVRFRLIDEWMVVLFMMGRVLGSFRLIGVISVFGLVVWYVLFVGFGVLENIFVFVLSLMCILNLRMGLNSLSVLLKFMSLVVVISGFFL